MVWYIINSSPAVVVGGCLYSIVYTRRSLLGDGCAKFTERKTLQLLLR